MLWFEPQVSSMDLARACRTCARTSLASGPLARLAMCDLHARLQDFNSLDAQREASEAYIKSQAHEGWRLVRDRYDDGGFSGGSMDRPALQKLLIDVQARRIDVIVVYKVDRLTRARSRRRRRGAASAARASRRARTCGFAFRVRGPTRAVRMAGTRKRCGTLGEPDRKASRRSDFGRSRRPGKGAVEITRSSG